MTEVIKCRAGIAEDCMDGIRAPIENYMPEDGTWDGDTIICNACYMEAMPFSISGAMLEDEFENAIKHYKQNFDYARAHPNPAELIKLAEETASSSNAGSPRWRSAIACKTMAEREVERRKINGY